MKKAYYSHDQQRSKQNIEGLIEQVIADAEPTIICNDKGQKTVLLSIDEYNSWQETMYLLYSDQNTCLKSSTLGIRFA